MDDEQENNQYRRVHIQHIALRSVSDPFSLTNRRFCELFRLTKDRVRYLFDVIGPLLSASNKINSIPPELKILTALAFYATGSYQRPTGQSYLLCMSQQSVGRAIHEVTDVIYHTLVSDWIKFPTTVEQKELLSAEFRPKVGFPSVIGAIDCTHINILAPVRDEHNYVDRRGIHSKNVQIVCDWNMRILSINARYAGSTHDSFIWRQSRIQEEMERSFARGEHYFLIGDSGYPLQPWLMTPILHPEPNSPESRYVNSHCSARNCIERCNMLFKGRFRCLMGERTLRYDPAVVGRLTTACAVLHNICLAGNVEIPNFDDAALRADPNFRRMTNVEARNEGERIRTNIVATYFA